MSKTIQIIVTSVLVSLVVGFAIGFMVATPSQPEQPPILGATIFNRQISFDEGIAVDGTVVIDGSGTITIASGQSLTVNGTTTVGTLDYDRIGKGVAVLTAAATTSVSAANLCDNFQIDWAPELTGASTTLADASDVIADCLPNTADYIDVVFRNTTGTAATITTFVAGTSSTLHVLSSSSANGTSLVLHGGTETKLRIVNNGDDGGSLDIFATLFDDL